MMKIEKLLTPYNLTVQESRDVKGIVIHYVGATGGAKANCQYYASQYIGASAHYFVGHDGEIWQSVEEKNIAWHCGAKSYLHPVLRNSNTLGIEMCVRKNGDTWYFEDATVVAAAQLTRQLMEKYAIRPEDVVRHYDITGKNCGAPFVDNNTRHTWDAFKQMLTKQEDTSTYTKITGKAKASVEQMAEYLQQVWKDAPEAFRSLPSLYMEEGEAENIRGDIAFAQSLLETGNFKFTDTAVLPSQFNYCGMGVTSKGETGNTFPDARSGIRAQIQHLKAYANKAALKQECIDPRFSYVDRGCAPYVEWLGQKEHPEGKGWAAGELYGEKILSILSKIIDGGSQNEVKPDPITELKGSLEVIYKGADGLNIRKEPCFGDNVVRVVHGGIHIVKGMSADGLWYQLISGEFICRNEKYVSFTPAWEVRVTADALNVRPEPGLRQAASGCIRDKGVYTIVRNVNGWGMLYSGAGYISLAYAKPL